MNDCTGSLGFCWWFDLLTSIRTLLAEMCLHSVHQLLTASFSSQEVRQQEELSVAEEHSQGQGDLEESPDKCQQELDEFHSDQDPPPEGLDSVDGGVPNQLETTETHPDLD